MSEEEAFATITFVTEKSRYYMEFRRRDSILFCHTFESLMAKKVPEVHKSMHSSFDINKSVSTLTNQ